MSVTVNPNKVDKCIIEKASLNAIAEKGVTPPFLMYNLVMGKRIHFLTCKDEINRTAICSHCGIVPIGTMGKNKYGNIQWRCRVALNAKRRKYSLDNFYKSNGICEICNSKNSVLIDHNHDTNIFRGWLCHRCNSLLGFCRDDIGILKSAIVYLDKRK